MIKGSDLRREPRQEMDPPGVAMLQQATGEMEHTGALLDEKVFVDVFNISRSGALIEITDEPSNTDVFFLYLYGKRRRDWVVYPCKVAWQSPRSKGRCLCGLEILNAIPEGVRQTSTYGLAHEDLSFLLNTNLLTNVPRDSLRLLLNSLSYRCVLRGTTFIRQGEEGDCLYIIHRGACRVDIERDGMKTRIARLHAGSVVGEMALLTGEPRSATVTASRDMHMWKLRREDFLEMIEEDSDLRFFLTELVTNRFNSASAVADRSIGKFCINRRLGAGGWSIVYAGNHNVLGLPVAIKMMRHDMAMEREFQQIFCKEASIIAGLSHPNIVQVYDIEEMYRTIFIIMEFLEGVSLKEVLTREGALSHLRTANILHQVCAGLGYAHARGVIHRDIKPANIHILANDKVKILDFGLACAPGTEDMSIAGTPKYAPPEQIDGDPVDHRADIYSLGIMAYEMVVGERPYPEDDIAELMDMHCEQDIPDPADAVDDLPDELREFILTSCRRDPKGRFADIHEAQAVLAPLVPEEGKLLRRRMTPFYLFYPEEVHASVTALLEDFSTKAKAVGVEFRTAEFRDV